MLFNWPLWTYSFILINKLVFGHITLTFPSARYPPLDFLDTARTVGPCGVPKHERSTYTTLQTNQFYNVTWRLQYPHQGGYRLYVIDYLGNVVEHLAPDKPVNDEQTSNSFDGLEDQSAEWKQIQFHTSCPNCSLVLERQALEWGPSYKFRSCAEIHIVDGIAEPDNRMCNGGEWKDGQCLCQPRSSGKFCQYKGNKLLKQIKELMCFKMTVNEMQIVLMAGKCMADGIYPNKKSCFCAYGYFGKDCKEVSASAFSEDECFRHLGNNSTPTAFKYGIFDETCFKRFDLQNGDSLFSRVIKDQVEIIMDYETESYVALGWRPHKISKTCRQFPDLNKERSDSRQGAKTSGYLQSTLDSSLHPMDCSDIVMASVVDNSFLHIEDMYTRDRSTPLADELLDGEQSITAAYGIQKDGRTIVMFRRGIREIEPTDHPLGPGKVFVIHAKGQTQGSYSHIAPSALEKKQTAKPNFYKNDQWRYHGASNRGVQILEFVTAMEMRFKGPLMHLDSSNSPTPPLGKVLERPPSSQIQFREQILPRPNQPTEDQQFSTSSAPTSLTPPQTTTQETVAENELTKTHDIEPEPSPEPQPEPSPEPEPPRLTILHRTTTEKVEQEQTNDIEEGETEAVNSTSLAASTFSTFESACILILSLQLMFRPFMQ
ncbi:DOMON domain-containing protein [Aphelenchoides bicaudatus]|nr:DOMON domain-containing protein [Aphelenchoides bicaudatus]